MTQIVLLAAPGDSTRIVYHAIAKRFGGVTVVLEEPVRARDLVRRRMKKLGLRTVAGQILFQAGIAPILRARSRARIREIQTEYALDAGPIPAEAITHVQSINDPEAVDATRRAGPRVIVVNGTRIIRADVIAQLDAPLINTHAGITPGYRGVHGAYWALANDDAAHAGVTIHLLDAGIDTGGVLAQGTIRVTPKDNYATYPYLQLGVALPLLIDVVASALDCRFDVQKPQVSFSKLWSHPSAADYLRNRFLRGVK